MIMPYLSYTTLLDIKVLDHYVNRIPILIRTYCTSTMYHILYHHVFCTLKQLYNEIFLASSLGSLIYVSLFFFSFGISSLASSTVPPPPLLPLPFGPIMRLAKQQRVPFYPTILADCIGDRKKVPIQFILMQHSA